MSQHRKHRGYESQRVVAEVLVPLPRVGHEPFLVGLLRVLGDPAMTATAQGATVRPVED